MASGNDSWKNWVIASLWTVSIILAGLGYNSVKDSIDKVLAFQTAQAKDWNDWKIEYERKNAMIWRAMDKICGYQTERMNREGKTPNYSFPEQK